MYRSTGYNSTECYMIAGYYSNYTCYYTPMSCPVDSPHRVFCHCYRYSSSDFTSSTCENVDGVHVSPTCYFDSFNCRNYWFNGQCYRRYSYDSYCTGMKDLSTGRCYYYYY